MAFHAKAWVLVVLAIAGIFALVGCAPQSHVWTAQEVFDHLEAQGLEVTNPTSDVSGLPANIGSDVRTNCRERVIFQILDVPNNQVFLCDRTEDVGETALYFLQNVEPSPDLITNSNALVLLVLSDDLNVEARRLYEVALATLGMRYIYQ